MKILFDCKLQVESHLILKNSKSIYFNKCTGKRFITTSDKKKLEQLRLISLIRTEMFKQKCLMPINLPVAVSFIFAYPKHVYYTKRGTVSLKIGDLSNLVQGPEDAMQKAGLLSNDALIYSLDGSRRVPGDGYSLTIIVKEFNE